MPSIIFIHLGKLIEYFPPNLGGIISEQKWFIFPGQFTLKLVLFAVSKKY